MWNWWRGFGKGPTLDEYEAAIETEEAETNRLQELLTAKQRLLIARAANRKLRNDIERAAAQPATTTVPISEPAKRATRRA